ncbi:MAG TPA: DUF2934 domain-containing protein [Phycisphaerae bacterium]|nr:DUF2934 domain-containing protein [Phycisphaerae bacterium]
MASKKHKPIIHAVKAVPFTHIIRFNAEATGNTALAVRYGANLISSLTRQKIAERAYQIYLKRGFKPGNAMNDWLEAERLLKAGL